LRHCTNDLIVALTLIRRRDLLKTAWDKPCQKIRNTHSPPGTLMVSLSATAGLVFTEVMTAPASLGLVTFKLIQITGDPHYRKSYSLYHQSPVRCRSLSVIHTSNRLGRQMRRISHASQPISLLHRGMMSTSCFERAGPGVPRLVCCPSSRASHTRYSGRGGFTTSFPPVIRDGRRLSGARRGSIGTGSFRPIFQGVAGTLDEIFTLGEEVMR